MFICKEGSTKPDLEFCRFRSMTFTYQAGSFGAVKYVRHTKEGGGEMDRICSYTPSYCG